MNYLPIFTEEEIKHICSAIPTQETIAYFRKFPKDFSRIKPGFRAKSMNDDAVFQTLYAFHKKRFIASYLNKHIDRWIKEINEELEKAIDSGLNQETAYIDVLSRSFFCGDASIYFKAKGEIKSEDYQRVMNSAVFYLSVRQKTNDEQNELLKKQCQELTEINNDLNDKVFKDGKKIETLIKKETENKKVLEEKNVLLKEIKAENERISEKASELESRLKKLQDDEVWKTSEMQNKIDSLTIRLETQIKENAELKKTVEESAYKLASAEEDIRTWRNQVRNRDNQLFTYKAERATLLTEISTGKKQMKELKETLDRMLSVEKTYKERLSILSTEKETYQQKNKELEGTLEELKLIEITAEAISKRYTNSESITPLHPEDMDLFDEYFNYNLKNLGFDINEDGASLFVDYLEKTVFLGIPLMIQRGLGINLANSLSNTLYGVPIAKRFSYSAGTDIQKLSEYLSNTPDRVVCIDGFIGNCNEMELIPVLEQHRNKIIILTYMYNKTLNYVPSEILSYVFFISADAFGPLIRVKDISEDPSEVNETSFVPRNTKRTDKRSQRIFCEIACECGIKNDTAIAMADIIEDEKRMNELLMFTLLPYISKVIGINPYNYSKRLQRYAGETGRCPYKEWMMRWFGQ